jgi:O-antigen ligase
VHAASAAAFDSSAARHTLRWCVAGLGFVLALLALGQQAVDPGRLYGRFTPLESATFFGPFANRNHFAGYMLLVVPLGLAELAAAVERARGGRRLSPAVLATTAGARVLYAGLLTLAALTALVATTSRAALVALGASLALGALGWRRRRAPGGLLLGLGLAAAALGLVGLARLEERFARSAADAAGRFAVWRDVAAGLDGRWLFGHGFNTFGLVFGRTTPFELPEGATPWPAELTAAARAGERPAYRSPAGVPGLEWYREAHNDYLQALAETGLAGLALVGWAVVAALRAARARPWQLAAVAGVALHEAVEFALQVPAVAVLFAVVSGVPPRGRP